MVINEEMNLWKKKKKTYKIKKKKKKKKKKNFEPPLKKIIRMTIELHHEHKMDQISNTIYNSKLTNGNFLYKIIYLIHLNSNFSFYKR